MIRVNFRNRVLVTIALSCFICTAAAVFVSSRTIRKEGEVALEEKSRAILSRLEVGAQYIAQMGGLDGVVQETLRKHPDGVLPIEQKERVLKNVPIFAAMELGRINAERENYQFRISSTNPRKKENMASAEERAILDKFQADDRLQEFTQVSADGKSIHVHRPVRLKSEQGCMTCHGHPKTSPWGNGKDILGYDMENMKDGDMKGMFTIISSLEPVQAKVQAATGSLVLWGAGFTLLALGVGFFVIRKPVGQLTDIVKNLDAASTELSSAADQISQVSQTLSVNATESAKSIESTASAVEEISSTATRNSDSAKQAAVIAQGSRQEAEVGEREIKQLIESMNDISKSSRKIEEIISVIDDIAFQTNLLALNAAVEAARAGEQGKGFGVVAEAVRNLAQRSATAAKDIEGLIKESVSRVDQGKEIADRSGAVLKRIVESANRSSVISGEIASLSEEQANGIDHVGKAMQEIDSTTQRNAASSEETSASAEEISSQAVMLKELVGDLVQMLEGGEVGEGQSFKGRRGGGRTLARDSFRPTSTNRGRSSVRSQNLADVLPLNDWEKELGSGPNLRAVKGGNGHDHEEAA